MREIGRGREGEREKEEFGSILQPPQKTQQVLPSMPRPSLVGNDAATSSRSCSAFATAASYSAWAFLDPPTGVPPPNTLLRKPPPLRIRMLLLGMAWLATHFSLAAEAPALGIAAAAIATRAAEAQLFMRILLPIHPSPLPLLSASILASRQRVSPLGFLQGVWLDVVQVLR
jgi:hypothetical protein